MKLFSIPLLFTIIVLAMGFFLRYVVPENKSKPWDHWDTVFVSTLLLGVALPTWSVYLSPHWPIPLMWSLVAFGVAQFSPFHAHKNGQCVMSKRLQYVLAGVSSAVGWMTYMMIFCEVHWRHITV